MLRKFNRDDLDKLWSLVKERSSSTDPTDDKERTLWVELKRLFEPDTDDILWKLQRYMHDPLTWRLYDTCGVHHVSTDRGHDIFMLVEKDYPLTRGILTLMLCNKLQVDQYSEMANELLKKIFILANRPRQSIKKGSTLKFAETHILVVFLEKPKESDGFEGIIDFLNASSIRYALTVNPTIYTSCIKQFWATPKAKTVNGEVQIQALVDGKKLTLMGYKNLTQKLSFHKAFFSPQWKFLIHTILQCLSAKTIAWNEFSSTLASAVISPKELGEGSEIPTDHQHTPTLIQPSTSQPQKKQPRRKQRKDTKVPQPNGSTEPITDEAASEEHVPAHSNDPLLIGEDRLKLNEMMELCTNLSQRVLDLKNIKTSQVEEITKLTERIKNLERRIKSRTPGLKRLKKVGRTARIESFKDEGLGDQKNASKQGRKIADLDADAEEIEVEKVVSTAEVTTVSVTTITVDELTLAQTLIEIKTAKPKAVTTAAITTTTAVTRPKASRVVVQEPSKFRRTTSSSQISQLPQAKDKAQLNAKLEEEEKLVKQREEDANIVEWDNVQAMIDADYELAARLQAQEQEELTIEEKSKLFVELMDKRKKHFARLRAKEQRRKPPTKAQKRNQMCTYLKNMAGFTHMVKGGKEKDEGSVTRAEESSSKRADTKLEQERIKKQKIDDDQEEAEMKNIWRLANGSSRRYSSMIKMLQNIDREDLETLWKLVKAKHGNIRPEEAYERVL
ncbi:hypothetical protein Tco_1047320 [Tanacetum coccineum]